MASRSASGRVLCPVRKCNSDGSGRLHQQSSAIGSNCKACKPVLFQLQLALPQRGAKRLPAVRKPASCSVPCAPFLSRIAACWRSVPRTKRRAHRQCRYQGLRMLQLAA